MRYSAHMKILYTSDIHTHPNHLFSLLSASKDEGVDAVVVGGDLIPHRLPTEDRFGIIDGQRMYLKETLIPAMERFRKGTDIPVYLDLGNDDLYLSRGVLEKYNGRFFNLLHMQRLPLTDAVDIIGYMAVPPTPFQRKDWEKPDSRETPYPPSNRVRLTGYITKNGSLEETAIDPASDDTIENDLSVLSRTIERPFIFVAHSPPYGTPLDVLDSGEHVGSGSIRRFIETWAKKGLLLSSLHGHIHEAPFRSGQISTTIKGAICINTGQHSTGNRPLRYVILSLNRDPLRVEIVKGVPKV
jgi:uncharacterized protein